MDKYDDLYQKIVIDGFYRGIRFEDARYFLEKTGFSLRTNGGDHFKYSMEGVLEIINLQPDKHDKKMAKDYQLRQIHNIFKKYKLGGANDEY